MNTRAESNWIVNTAPIAVIAVVGIGVLPFVSAIPWWARILLVAVCVVFALIGVLGTVHGIEQRRRGWWLVHRFAAGFVMERARGGIVATAYGEARAELMTYHEPGDSTSDGVDYVLLRLRFPDGGTWVMTEATHDAPDVLRELGERCGAGEPRAIEYRAALDLAIGREWV